MRPNSLLQFALLICLLFCGVSCKKSEKKSEKDWAAEEEAASNSLEQKLEAMRTEIANNNGALPPRRWEELFEEIGGGDSAVILLLGQPHKMDANVSSERNTLIYYNKALATTDYNGTKEVQDLEIYVRNGSVDRVEAAGDD